MGVDTYSQQLPFFVSGCHSVSIVVIQCQWLSFSVSGCHSVSVVVIQCHWLAFSVSGRHTVSLVGIAPLRVPTSRYAATASCRQSQTGEARQCTVLPVCDNLLQASVVST